MLLPGRLRQAEHHSIALVNFYWFNVDVIVQSAFGNRVSSSQLQLYFGPNEAILGRHYTDDPAVDESKITLAKYSCLSWLKKFPHWHMSVKFMPPTPLPPGVAAHRAAALSEGKDPDIAVWDARSKVILSSSLSPREFAIENPMN